MSDHAREWFGNDHPSLARCWHPVARSSDVTDAPLAVELLGEAWCVVRIDGELAALRDECPHRLTPLSAGRVVDGALQCAYHGYRYGADGRCVEVPSMPDSPIPARFRCNAAAGVADHLGLVWIAPQSPIVALPEVPEHHDPAFVHVPLPVMEWQAGASQMADNFLDLAHFPFLHLATFGAPDDRAVGDYEVQRDGWTFAVDYSHVTKALADSHRAGPSEPGSSGPDPSGAGSSGPDPSGAEDWHSAVRHDRFVFTAPHHVYLRIDYPDEGSVLTISFCHQPVRAGVTRLFCTDYRNDIPDEPTSIGEAAAFQLAVATEDRALLERNRHKAVPLDLTAELHTRADRITVEMRRVLGALSATTATTTSAPATTSFAAEVGR